MSENSLPVHVEAFVRRYIPTVAHLECLVRMVRSPTQQWSAGDMSVAIGVDEKRAREVLDDLKDHGFLSTDGHTFQYAPNSTLVGDGAAALVAAYDRFPVQLIRIVYEPRTNPARSFADAFRLRKD